MMKPIGANIRATTIYEAVDLRVPHEVGLVALVELMDVVRAGLVAAGAIILDDILDDVPAEVGVTECPAVPATLAVPLLRDAREIPPDDASLARDGIEGEKRH